MRAREGHQRRGVEAAAQVEGDRHVGAEAEPHRLLERGAQLLGAGGVLAVERRVEAPIAPQRDGAALDDHQVAGRERAHALEHRARGREVLVGRHVRERAGVPARLDAHREERLRLRRDQDAARSLRVDERLDPEAIARRDEPPAPRVPEDERDLAAEVLDERVAVLLVEMDDELAVAPGAEAVPLRLELPAGALEVVELSVDDGDDAPVLVGERLRAALDVDDREAPVPETRDARGVDEDALAVRSAVRDRGEPAPDRLRAQGGLGRDDPDHAAHQPRTAASPKRREASSVGRRKTLTSSRAAKARSHCRSGCAGPRRSSKAGPPSRSASIARSTGA